MDRTDISLNHLLAGSERVCLDGNDGDEMAVELSQKRHKTG